MPPLPAWKPNSTEPSNDAERRVRPTLAARVVLALVAAYKVLLSPYFTGSCRFQPSCADYMTAAVRAHGAARGSWLGLKRLARCHPWGGCGIDPVPSSATHH